jgi:hypothetical protein
MSSADEASAGGPSKMSGVMVSPGSTFAFVELPLAACVA